MIRHIKYLIGIENDYVNEINNIINSHENIKIYFEIDNLNRIKVTLLDYDQIIYFMSEKEFLKVLNNLIINKEITLLLTNINVYHKEISDFIRKNRIEKISLEKFSYFYFKKLQLSSHNIKSLKVNLDFINESLSNIMKYINKMQSIEYFYCEYRGKHLERIIKVLKYNKTIKYLHLSNTDYFKDDIYEEIYKKAYKKLFLNNNTLITFKSIDGVISNDAHK